MVYLQTVTHPSINRARRRVTPLIDSNALPLSQATTLPDTALLAGVKAGCARLCRAASKTVWHHTSVTSRSYEMACPSTTSLSSILKQIFSLAGSNDCYCDVDMLMTNRTQRWHSLVGNIVFMLQCQRCTGCFLNVWFVWNCSKLVILEWCRLCYCVDVVFTMMNVLLGFQTRFNGHKPDDIRWQLFYLS